MTLKKGKKWQKVTQKKKSYKKRHKKYTPFIQRGFKETRTDGEGFKKYTRLLYNPRIICRIMSNKKELQGSCERTARKIRKFANKKQYSDTI